MSATQQKPTFKELRAEAQRLGITAESVGKSLEEFLRIARDNDDPFGYLAIYAGPATLAETKTAQPEPPAKPTAESVTITVPMSRITLTGFVGSHVDVQLSHSQAVALRRLFHALDAAGTRLTNGRRVATTADAVRWILEQTAPLSL